MEIIFVLLFTAAGVAAALLARRVGSASPAVRWLASAFLIVLAANLALYLWPLIAEDPAGARRGAAIVAGLLLLVWGYVRLLRAARRAAGERNGR